MNFHPLELTNIRKPIVQASTLSLKLPPHLKEAYSYKPGQHLIFKFEIDGKEVRRSYSLNSCPYSDDLLEVTIKRVKDGLISNHINDKLQIGDELKVSTPQGRFYANIDEKAYRTYFLFAAGSGITPIISILKSVLVMNPHSSVNLLYGNTNQNTIIFKNELDSLQSKFQSRLKIVHTLSDPKVWTVTKSWKGRQGRIDTENIEWFIANYPPKAQDTEYYICGPGVMNYNVKKCLQELGVPRELIHIEQFGSGKAQESKAINAFDNALLTAYLGGQKFQTNVSENQTLLESLKDAKVNSPYSCESGVCGTCVARIKHGEVEMKSCMALEQKEIDGGLILTCQSIPVTSRVDISYEN